MIVLCETRLQLNLLPLSEASLSDYTDATPTLK